MKNKDQLSSGITSKKEKTINIIVFVLLSLGAVVMIFPFFYMIMTSFMTKNQYLSGQLRVIPDPWVWGKYSEVMAKGNWRIHFFACGICFCQDGIQGEGSHFYGASRDDYDSVCGYHDTAVCNVYEIRMDRYAFAVDYSGMFW